MVTIAYHEAMLSTSEKLAVRLKQAVKESGLSQVAIAEKCAVSKQAVSGWLKTGRIDKQHLLKVAGITSRAMSWFVEEVEQYAYVQGGHKVTDEGKNPTPSCWPFVSISATEYGCLSERQKGLVEGYVKGLLSESQNINRDGLANHH